MAGSKQGGKKEHERYKRLFKAALAYKGDTLESWARRNKVSANYARNVRHGEVNLKYTALMDQTIAEFQEAVAQEYAAARVA